MKLIEGNGWYVVNVTYTRLIKWMNYMTLILYYTSLLKKILPYSKTSKKFIAKALDI